MRAGRVGGDGRQQAPGDLLAQLHAPLVEGVDAPQQRLHVDTVFVHGQQRTQAGGRERIEQQEGGRPVAGIGLLRVGVGGAVGQRLALRQQVGEQGVVAGAVRVRRPRHADEVRRHGVGALVQGLDEAVLAAGAGPAPQHRHGGHRHRRAVAAHRLAEAFHHQLLQVRRQQGQAVVVRQHRVRIEAECVAVPDAGQGVQDRKIGLGLRCEHVRVHRRRTVEQFAEAFHAQRQRNHETHCRPQRVTSADPVPHRQDALLRDAERGGLVHVGGHREQARVIAQPWPQQCGVEQRLLRAEALGHQHHRGARRIQSRHQRGGRAGVGIVEEMHAEAAVVEVAQRLHGQPRAEVGAADADVDDVGDLAGAQRRDQRTHALERRRNLRTRGLDHRTATERRAQRGMQGGPAFRWIDDGAVEHRAHALGNLGRPRHRRQVRPGRAVHALAGEVGVYGPDPQRQLGGASRVFLDEAGERSIHQPRRMFAQGRPLRLDPHRRSTRLHVRRV